MYIFQFYAPFCISPAGGKAAQPFRREVRNRVLAPCGGKVSEGRKGGLIKELISQNCLTYSLCPC